VLLHIVSASCEYKNMRIPTCDKENGTFVTSINWQLKSSATKLHNLCSTMISKDFFLFILFRKGVCDGVGLTAPLPAGLFEFCKYTLIGILAYIVVKIR
jgi:hypothetical protein